MANNPRNDPALKKWYKTMPKPYSESGLSWAAWGRERPTPKTGYPDKPPKTRKQLGSAGMKALQGRVQATQWGTAAREEEVSGWRNTRPKGSAKTHEAMVTWGSANPNLPRHYSVMMSGKNPPLKGAKAAKAKLPRVSKPAPSQPSNPPVTP